MIKKCIYLFSVSILFTTAIQSQDISNKWAINIGSGLVIYPGEYDPYLGFRYTEQFPRISISRYMFKNITFSGAIIKGAWSGLINQSNPIVSLSFFA